VLVKDEDDEPFRIESVHPGIDVENVVENTGFELTVPTDVPLTAVPTQQQLDLLRGKIDPFGTVKFDFVSGKDRLAYLKTVLDAEWERAAARIA
jgi:glutaconate CoA-transferase, subunit B